jgi:hypothetical protein
MFFFRNPIYRDMVYHIQTMFTLEQKLVMGGTEYLVINTSDIPCPVSCSVSVSITEGLISFNICISPPFSAQF